MSNEDTGMKVLINVDPNPTDETPLEVPTMNYGTSMGVKKAWLSRERGQGEEEEKADEGTKAKGLKELSAEADQATVAAKKAGPKEKYDAHQNAYDLHMEASDTARKAGNRAEWERHYKAAQSHERVLNKIVPPGNMVKFKDWAVGRKRSEQ